MDRREDQRSFGEVATPRRQVKTDGATGSPSTSADAQRAPWSTTGVTAVKYARAVVPDLTVTPPNEQVTAGWRDRAQLSSALGGEQLY